MKKFLVFANEIKDKDLVVTKKLCAMLEERGKEWVMAEQDENHAMKADSIPEDIDCVVVLGGDGSFIAVARNIWKLEIPILGVNLGTLGYLTEVEVKDLEKALDRILTLDYYIEERMMLKAECSTGDVEFALNDVVFNRRGGLRVAHFSVYVNDELLTSYEADGVILSTPTGSTAYNRSAGGPIVKPSANCIIVTPICPHDTSVGSIVLDGKDEVTVVVDKGRRGEIDRMNVNLDGARSVSVETGDWVRVHKTRVGTKIIKLNSSSFIETLRSKLKGN
ncbi:MAG: NAD(+)/NADH kinase [Dorea sp.]|nr:NAD(+)/NADH kinase [Dorea sp.]